MEQAAILTEIANANKAVDQAMELLDKMQEGFKRQLTEEHDIWMQRLQQVCDKWPRNGDPVEVTYSGVTYTTWTLPFEGEESVTSLLTSLGWDASDAGDIAKLEFELEEKIELEEDDEVAWRHIQEVFRRCVLEPDTSIKDDSSADDWSDVEREWSAEDDSRYPPLQLSMECRGVR